MREHLLVYLVPPGAVALYGAVCLGLPVRLQIILPMLTVFLLCAAAMRRHKRLLVLCVMGAAACAALTGFAVFREVRVEPVRALNGQEHEVTATVLRDADIYEESQRARLSVEMDGKHFRTQCYLPKTDPPLLAGDRIRAVLSFYVPDTQAGFDRAAYQASEGCYVAASCAVDDDGQAVQLELLDSRRDSLRFVPQRISRFCRSAVQNALPEREAGLLSGLLLGGSRNFSETDQTAFRIAGLSHLVAVSGLHIGFLAGFCTLLFGKRWGTIVSVPLVLVFVPIAGATPSVVRAALMYLTAAGGFVCRRRSSGVNALLAALAILLIANPYAIAGAGLQLSFASTLGLLLFARKLQNALERPFMGAPQLLRRLLAAIAGAVSCTVCASFFTAPILLVTFGAVSVLAPISNLMTVGVTSICFVGGLLLCFAAAVCPALVPMVAGLVRPLLRYLLWAANTVADLGFGVLHPDNRFGLAALGLLFAGIVLYLMLGKRIRWRYVLPGMVLVFAVLCSAEIRYQNGHYTVTYLSCGAGQAVLVSDTEHVILIDCAATGYQGADQQVQEWLRWNGIRRLDAVVLTAVDRGHARDLPALLESTEVSALYIPAGCQERKTNADLLALARKNNAQEITAPETLNTGITPVELFPVADGKLGVNINDRVLILHSPTEKQLATYLKQNTLSEAETLVFSAGHLPDSETMAQLVQATGAQQIIIAAGYRKGARSYKGLDVQNTYFTGEIMRQFKKE